MNVMKRFTVGFFPPSATSLASDSNVLLTAPFSRSLQLYKPHLIIYVYISFMYETAQSV